MSDIVQLLRELAECKHSDLSVASDGADEITALRAEVERLRAALEIMSMMGGYTKLHPDETAPGIEQNTYSWGVSDGYKEMAEMARAALEEEDVNLPLSSD